jgi:thiamine-phosphate diphosphorylase
MRKSMKHYDYDLFVIGAGSGGVRAARMAASLGVRVATAEDRYLGGTCVNVGCVPKKLFVYASHFREEFIAAHGFGWSTNEAQFDWTRLLAQKDQEIKRLQGVYENLLVNSGVTIAGQLNADGIHLTARDLMALNNRPAAYKWVAASCHNLDELQHAERIGVDFVVLAPVLATNTHPGANPLGWEAFKELVSMIKLPVYALGGMMKEHVHTAQSAGAQGIAGITVFLD